MLYPQQIERENRFKLALRTALPSFLLIIVLFVLFFNNDEFLLFFTLVIAAVLLMSYYNLYVIYSGFNENMMDIDTHVFNYKSLKMLLIKELKNKYEMTMMMIKVGDLESINAHYGRELANNVLRETIKMLLEKISAEGFKKVPVGYYGGGYFILFFKAQKEDISEKLAPLFKRYKNLYIDDIEIETQSAMCSCSKGNFEENIKILLDLINTAHFDEIAFIETNDQESKLKGIEHRIRAAIANESISLQYQSVKNGHTGKVEIVEFSVKLVDHNQKYIHHSDIMPVINSLGLEKAFYLLVLKKIMQFVLENRIDSKFSTNISAFALRHKEIRSEIPLLMREYEIKPGQMILAVLEEHYYKHIQRYKEMLEAYRELGIAIAFTNIGSNTPALEYLKFMQVDYIKYDRYYTDSANTSMMATVYDGIDAIMQQRGIKRWAIMIEDAEQEHYLAAKGVDYLQGWHIDRFHPVDTIEKQQKEVHEVR